MWRKCLGISLWITVVAFSLQACTFPPKTGKASYAPSTLVLPADIKQTLQEQADDYNKTVEYCQSQLESIRRDQKGLSYWLIGIAILGAGLGAAGSALLAASAANKATAALFSAGAGVASGVQPTMAKEGETSEFYRTAYSTLWGQLQDDVTQWNAIPRDGTPPQTQIAQQQKVIEQMNAHCRFIPYPPTPTPKPNP